jgi:hypothetical protein
VVYGLALSLFFVIVLAVVGTKFMAMEPGAGTGSISRTQIAQAFVGVFLLSLVFGLIYSTVISFFLAKRERGSERI